MSNITLGIPNVLDPIPNISVVPAILSIPGVGKLINVPSLAVMQSIPGILGILKATSTLDIPSIPSIGSLLNVPSLGDLVRIPNIGNLLNFDSLSSGLMKGDGIGAKKRAPVKPFWGILPALSKPGANSTPVIQADTVVAFEFRNSWRVSTFPQEQGAFESYNKVSSPYEARATFTKGGTEDERAAFLQAIDDVANSLDLFDIVTPERVYHDANIYDYCIVRRAHSGVGLISVELLFEEVRVTAVTQFSGTVASNDQNQALDLVTQIQGSQSLDLVTQIQSVGKKLPGIVGIPSVPSAFSAINLGNVQGMVANNAGAVVGRVFGRR